MYDIQEHLQKLLDIHKLAANPCVRERVQEEFACEKEEAVRSIYSILPTAYTMIHDVDGTQVRVSKLAAVRVYVSGQEAPIAYYHPSFYTEPDAPCVRREIKAQDGDVIVLPNGHKHYVISDNGEYWLVSPDDTFELCKVEISGTLRAAPGPHCCGAEAVSSTAGSGIPGESHQNPGL